MRHIRIDQHSVWYMPKKELSQIIKQNKVGKQQERNIEESHVTSSSMRTTYSLITVLKSRAPTKVFLLVVHIPEATQRKSAPPKRKRRPSSLVYVFDPSPNQRCDFI